MLGLHFGRRTKTIDEVPVEYQGELFASIWQNRAGAYYLYHEDDQDKYIAGEESLRVSGDTRFGGWVFVNETFIGRAITHVEELNSKRRTISSGKIRLNDILDS